jgi:hypothetical protein
MNTYLIPLSGIAQTFSITFIDVVYNLTVYWNDSPDAGWMLDIADSSNNSIVAGIPMVTGVDLLDGLGYLNFGGSLYIYTDGDPFAVPTLDTLGVSSNLYFQTVSASS